MKWKAKNPVPGDLKVRHRFAWLPTRIGRYKIWLEHYDELREYTERECVKGEWKLLDVKLYSR